ncbi:hypothetical protein [Membranihabitans marinus]|uniref:hypothetical protein n=1 Tax=Membranihabitans marinus TaxID=1227546 RepID=UPI001F3DEDD3|nr:hypothetical protein [Membranihabitans marinus]
MKEKSNIIYIVVLIIIIWLLSALLTYFLYETPADRGAFGDMFGAVNALFSGLALAGVIYTILLQSKELSLQRDELKQTRGVFEKQQFESTFFQLLKLQQNILNEVDVHITTRRRGGEIIKETTKVGQNALLEFQKILNSEYVDKSIVDSKVDEAKFVQSLIRYFEVDMTNNLTVYFSILSNVIEFADGYDHSDKTFYVQLITNQLAPIEKYYLFHKILTQKLVSDIYLNMTKNIPESLFSNKSHYEYYIEKIGMESSK